MLDRRPGEQPGRIGERTIAIEPMRKRARRRFDWMMGAPPGVSNEHQRADALMVAQEEIDHGELLMGIGAGHIELHETQAGRFGQFGRLQHLCRGIADDSRVEIDIACTAGGRSHGVPVIDPINAEEAKSPAVIGIDQKHQCEQQQQAGPQRADADRQTAAPFGRGIRTGNRQSHGRSVLRVGSGWPADRGRPRRRARALADASIAR